MHLHDLRFILCFLRIYLSCPSLSYLSCPSVSDPFSSLCPLLPPPPLPSPPSPRRLHTRLLRAVHQLLGTEADGVRLSQCDLWGKQGTAGDTNTAFTKYSNSDQRIHCDYPNHSLVMPPLWESPEVVSMIIYYDDSGEVGGETRVVPREGPNDPAYHHLDCASDNASTSDNGSGSGSGSGSAFPLLLTPGARADLPWVNDCTHAEAGLREDFPEVYRFRQQHLYPRERKVGFETGSVLFYRHDLWHR
jgi:hypothetical protein